MPSTHNTDPNAEPAPIPPAAPEPRKPRRRRAEEPSAIAAPAPPPVVKPTGFKFGTGEYGYPRHRSKVRDLLTDEDRAEYERLIADRRTTLQAAWAWLRDRGYPVGRISVERHRRDFHRRLDETRRYAEVAHEFARLARDSGLTMTEGALGGLQQVLMQYLVSAATNNDVRDKFTPKDLATLNDAVGGSVDVKQKVDALVAGDSKGNKRKAGAGATDPGGGAAAAGPGADADVPRHEGRPGWADTSKTAEIAERVRRVLGV